MKKIIISITILSLFGSCQLQEDPKGLTTPGQFFQNEDEINQFLIGAYTPLSVYDFYGMAWWNIAEAINDQVTCREDLRSSFAYDAPGDGRPLLWKAIYAGINATNLLINGVNETPILTDQQRTHYLAEARFLRGLYYFHAIVAYGNVPLIVETTPFEEAMTMSRTEVNVVWDQIVSDLTYAAENGREPYGGMKSRADKWTALAFLSRVYLYKGDFANASLVAQRVKQEGPYGLLPDFAQVFLESNEQSEEVVFSVEFLQNVRTSSFASFFTARADKEPSSTPGLVWNGWGSNAVATGLITFFEEGDERKDQTVVNTNWLDGNKPFVTNPWNFGPKFWDFDNPRAQSAKDFLVMRYAEVLLNLAEAENEANGPTQIAYEALNEVRSRAGLSALSGLSTDQFRERMRHERGAELAGEGHRKWDLLRWGIWLETMKSLPDADIPPVGRQNLSDRFALLPIPDVEIAKNPNLLPNNPGY